jgi:hypothetical protein
MRIRAFWDIAPCSLAVVDRRFRGAYGVHRRPDYGGNPRISETSVYSETIWRYIPEGSNVAIYFFTTIHWTLLFQTSRVLIAVTNRLNCSYSSKRKLTGLLKRCTSVHIYPYFSNKTRPNILYFLKFTCHKHLYHISLQESIFWENVSIKGPWKPVIYTPTWTTIYGNILSL